ncbi:MAG: glycosyltransferase family 2 protein [Parcubacteria group bacterium]|nr:glycosyltransferase family 2 protein [Parcubacteria group bacterium]
MPKKVAIIISPNYKDYAEKYLTECVDSIKRQNYDGAMKIFITDNESTAESFAYLKNILEDKIPLTLPARASQWQAGPFIKGGFEIIRNKNNDGFAKGNNDAMKLALKQGFEYVILFNMDTVVASDCVSKMIKVLGDKKLSLDSRRRGNDKEKSGNDKKEIGAVQARLMLWPEKEKINSLGNVTHFLGFGYSLGYNEKMTNDKFPMTNEICYPSGAAVLFRAEALRQVGLFDEEFWMYNEDQDLGWRLWLAGFSCVLAPEAVVCHKYEFSRSVKKYYWLDRNRIIASLKNYHWATLLLIAPAFVIMEIGLIFFAFKGGWLKEKIKVYKYFLSLKNWRYLVRARKQTQELRRVKDKDIIKLFSGKIWYQEIGEARLKVANVIFNLYWQIAKVLIWW